MYMLLLFGIHFLPWILDKILFYIPEATGHFWFAWLARNMVKLSDSGSIAQRGVSARTRVLGQFLCWARMSLRKWAEAQTGSYSNTSGSRGRSCRENIPSQHLSNVTAPNPLCPCTACPGSILAEQGVPEGRNLAESMPCCLESWGEGAGLILLLGSYKNKCTLPAPGSSQMWPRSCWLLQLWIKSQPCALQAQFLCEVSCDSASCKLH